MSAALGPDRPLPVQTPIELYGAQTGNCIRAAIALEEAMLPYTVRLVDLRSGEHRRDPFLSLNPAGKVPTIVDHAHGESPLVLSQSNAIILYAAERAPGRLLPEQGESGRALAFERFFYFVTDVIAPNHASFFLRAQGASDASVVLDRCVLESLRMGERYVSQSTFMAGNDFSIADIAAFTIAAFLKAQIDWDELPNLQRWFRDLEERPSIARGYQAFGSSAA
jgi:GST-like protein